MLASPARHEQSSLTVEVQDDVPASRDADDVLRHSSAGRDIGQVKVCGIGVRVECDPERQRDIGMAHAFDATAGIGHLPSRVGGPQMI